MKKWIWKHRGSVFGFSGGFLCVIGGSLFWMIIRKSPSFFLIGLSVFLMILGIIFLVIASWDNN